MKKIVVSTYMSLDNVVEDPGTWTMSYWSDELARYARTQLFASDSLLLGRKTYQGFAGAWPGMTDEDGFADRMNSLPKHVASHSLTADAMTWNATLLGDDVAAEVTSLKQQPGQDILIYSSTTFVKMLLQHNLIDELRLWVHPVVRGSGQRMFEAGETAQFQLVDTVRFDTGVVILCYKPNPQ